MASIVPSGRQLGRRMAAALPPGTRNVVELGAGTGAITGALLEHGIAADHLLAVEMNPALKDVLKAHLPRVHVACGDARHLRTQLHAHQLFKAGEVDAICSSLGMLTMPKELQHDILAAAFEVLRPGGVFVQYTYGPFGHPMHDDVSARLDLCYKVTGAAWLNLPPARVFVYSRA